MSGRAGAAAGTAAAEALVSTDRLAELTAAMVDIASPTGEERPLACWLAAELGGAGLADATVQELGGAMANAHARLAGAAPPGAGRPSLLLYAPLDTVTSGDAAEDLPWAGLELRDDMRARASRRGDVVVGLGAQNPKGHGACVVAAAEALARAGVPLGGDLLVGFGAGGMPSNRRRPELPDGHGVGCAALVEALRPGAAVIAKTGWAVSWEEVGLAWFEVEVEGSHTYVGSRHLLSYRSAIADAARLVLGLEDWFERWAEQHRSGLVAPQGVVGAIEGGWTRMPAFPPAVCRFRVDLRLSPRTTPEEAEEALGAEVARLAAAHGSTARCRQLVAIPGTTTDPGEPIITTAIRAWEGLTGRPHQPIAGLSGATDANILRALGVPTARVGLPKVRPERLGRGAGGTVGDEVDFQLGMNAVDADDLVLLTRLLIRIAVDWCGVTGATDR